MRPETTRFACAIVLAVAVVATVITAAGCGKNAFVGTWFNTSTFPTSQNGVHELVTTLVVGNGGTWRLSDPATNADGTTTPHHMAGTYKVDGDKLRLYSDGSLFLTGVQRDGTLTLGSLRFTRHLPAPGSVTALPTWTTPYRNSQFRFSLRLPGAFSEDDYGLSNAQMTDADFARGFLNTWTPLPRDGTFEAVLIQVTRLRHALLPTQMERALSSARTAQVKLATAEYRKSYPDVRLSPFRSGRLNGTPCYVYSASFPSFPFGRGREYEKNYYLMVGAFAYTIHLASPAAQWPADSKTLDQIADTFRTF